MPVTKKSPMADRVRYGSEFERTRENMAEFSRGGKASRLLTNAFRELLINAKDRTSGNRLVQTCMRILATDAVNDRGERTVGNGEVNNLRNFNFNGGLSFYNTLFARINQVYDRPTGLLTVSFPAFKPGVMVEAPRSATHFLIEAAAIAIDFDNDKYDHTLLSSAELDLNAQNIPAFDLALQLPVNSTLPVILSLGVQFFQKMENGSTFVHKSKNFNAATIVQVFKP